jgi:PAS domain S-box-containing protein
MNLQSYVLLLCFFGVRLSLPNSTDQVHADPFHLFVDSVQDYAIFMLDVDGNVLTWNAGAERIKGYKTSEIVGRNFSCFYTPEDVQLGKPQQLLHEAARKGRVEYEGWRVRKDGSRFWANVVLTAVRDQDGTLLGFGKVTRDLTERMWAQNALKESNEKLAQSERSLRELSLYLLRAQDEERRLIGREMHDSLGQILSVLKMKLDALSARESELSPQLSQCSALVEEAVTEVRTVSYLLYPPMLEELGLGSAIPWYLEGFSKRSGINVSYDIPDDFGRLHRDVELVLFRVLQEGLTNVHKHSGSSTAVVRLRRTPEKAVLELTDQGKGFPQANPQNPDIRRHGVGLRGMDERLRQLRGELQVTSGPRGTQLKASVPLPHDPDTR